MICAYCHKADAVKIYCKPCMTMLIAKWRARKGPKPVGEKVVLHAICRECGKMKPRTKADRCQTCAGLSRRRAPRFLKCRRCGEPKYERAQLFELCVPCRRDAREFTPTHNTAPTTERIEAARQCRAMLAATLKPRITLRQLHNLNGGESNG